MYSSTTYLKLNRVIELLKSKVAENFIIYYIGYQLKVFSMNCFT